MFTGIVSAVAKVVDVRGSDGAVHRIGVEHSGTARHLKIGSSVAVNGCCLTVVKKQGPVFFADVVPETLRRTNLGGLKVGKEVNLELPLTAAATVDGHLVQGHVDSTAEVTAIKKTASGREVTISLPGSISRFVAEKGSIAVDGVSLTVSGVERSSFTVALIPHTLDATIAGHYRRGSIVNLEADVIARYVARNLRQ